MKRLAQHGMVIAAGFWILTVLPASAQENTGTAFGIPTSSPGVMWPRGSSLETLGFGRLYPNGPEFGLGNTSGGFGMTGTGLLSGVGLAERSVSPLVQEQLVRPHTSTQQLTDTFNSASVRATNTFSAAISNQFRSEMRVGSTSQSADLTGLAPLVLPAALPSVDSVLQDRPATSDAVLKTGL